MSRPLRLEFEGALYHVTSRGDRREPIFEDAVDRRELLEIVGDGFDRFDAEAFAYCLMGNHYHFVIRTRRPNLSRLMRHVNGVYTQAFNRRHGKVGHLFQGRFKAVLVDEDAYLLEVCRYVDLNPVRAGIVRRPQDWNWSSYRAHAGLGKGPSWLNTAAVRERLAPEATAQAAAARYAEFVAQGRGLKLWEEALSGQIFLGGATFVARMQAKIAGDVPREIPRAQQRKVPKPLHEYLGNVARADRDKAIAQAFFEGGHSQTAIAKATGLSVSRISRVQAAQRAKGKT